MNLPTQPPAPISPAPKPTRWLKEQRDITQKELADSRQLTVPLGDALYEARRAATEAEYKYKQNQDRIDAAEKDIDYIDGLLAR